MTESRRDGGGPIIAVILVALALPMFSPAALSVPITGVLTSAEGLRRRRHPRPPPSAGERLRR